MDVEGLLQGDDLLATEVVLEVDGRGLLEQLELVLLLALQDCEPRRGVRAPILVLEEAAEVGPLGSLLRVRRASTSRSPTRRSCRP